MKGSWFLRAPRVVSDGPQGLDDAMAAALKHAEERIRGRYAKRMEIAGRQERKTLQAEMDAEIRRDVAALQSGKPTSNALF